MFNPFHFLIRVILLSGFWQRFYLQSTQRRRGSPRGGVSAAGGGGFGGGVTPPRELLLQESIWLDSLTNCIKRQTRPWSAQRLIDGSTHSRRKSWPTERRQISRPALLCCATSPPSPNFPTSLPKSHKLMWKLEFQPLVRAKNKQQPRAYQTLYM